MSSNLRNVTERKITSVAADGRNDCNRDAHAGLLRRMRRKVLLWLFVIPVNIEPSLAHDIGFVQFDEEERVRRAGIQTVPDGASLYEAVEMAR